MTAQPFGQRRSGYLLRPRINRREAVELPLRGVATLELLSEVKRRDVRPLGGCLAI
jgi:hypothetical protein